MSANIFTTLLALDVSKFVEKKGQFSYLSWTYAVAELQKVDPDAEWDVVEYPLPLHPHVLAPYCITPSGCFVKVVVTVKGRRRAQHHPVIDERNRAIKEPTCDQINKSIMRCLVKAIALHGLGLNVFAGEDLPMGEVLDDAPKEEPVSETTRRAIGASLDALGIGKDLVGDAKSKARGEYVATLNDGHAPKTEAEASYIRTQLEMRVKARTGAAAKTEAAKAAQ